MPTSTGLPKAGETWKRTFRLPPDWRPQSFTFTVIERSRGDYWSLRVVLPDGKRQLFVDAAAWWTNGELTWCDPAAEPRGPINV